MKCEVCSNENSKMRVSSVSPYVSEGLHLCDKCHKEGLIPYNKLVNFIANYEYFRDIPKEVQSQIDKILSYYCVSKEEFGLVVAWNKAVNRLREGMM